MLQIVLYSDQSGILEELKGIFPDIYLEKFMGLTMYYRATLIAGPKGTQQIQFLRSHAIPFCDKEQQREQCIRTFFSGVELEGKRITMITFQPLSDTVDDHVVILTTEDDAVYLRFPPNWDGWNGQAEIL